MGTNLQEHDEKYKNYRKESRKKYNKLEGESYNEYLHRIDSPLKDVEPASMEGIEAESISYATKDKKEESNRTIENDRPYHRPARLGEKDEDEDEDEDEYDDYQYHREEIVDGMSGRPQYQIDGNIIRDRNNYGRPQYQVDGNIIRDSNNHGRPAYRIDGKYIKDPNTGRPLYYIDGDVIRDNNNCGRVVGRRRRF